MAFSDTTSESHFIKNLLFVRAVPAYEPPVPTVGYNVYDCSNCGDKFLLESSLDYHTNRQSVKITFLCRICNQTKIFYNRCNMLQHIRSHSCKSVTINVNDLKIEPLPLSFFNINPKDLQDCALEETVNNKTGVQDITGSSPHSIYCTECKTKISSTGDVIQDRKNHWMKSTNTVYTCAICLLSLPTKCALNVHTRGHLEMQPYFCVECGEPLAIACMKYPFLHDCEGFNMMRATARIICPQTKCRTVVHPNHSKDHIMNYHIKSCFKCSMCAVFFYEESLLRIHFTSLHGSLNCEIMKIYHCDICCEFLPTNASLDKHAQKHVKIFNFVFPCWVCGAIMPSAAWLLEHSSKIHCQNTTVYELLVASKDFSDMRKNEDAEESDLDASSAEGTTNMYRVIKKCDKCYRNFSFKCNFESISILPTKCPFNCTEEGIVEETIKCNECKIELHNSQEVLFHYRKYHNFYMKEVKVSIAKLRLHDNNNIIENAEEDTVQNNSPADIPSKTKKKKIGPKRIKRSVQFSCTKCDFTCATKAELENHFKSHKDSCMAYQCMECGECFAVKPSFSTHLLLQHRVLNIEEYIQEKSCYNGEAFLTRHFGDPELEGPLKENQCNICRDEFDNATDLEKHYRVHGMAFLKRNSAKKSP